MGFSGQEYPLRYRGCLMMKGHSIFSHAHKGSGVMGEAAISCFHSRPLARLRTDQNVNNAPQPRLLR